MVNRHQQTVVIATPLILAVLLGAAGCQNVVPAPKFQAVQRELQAASEQIQLLETRASAQQETIRSLRSQIETIRDVGGDPGKILVAPVRIELASRSGAYDDDGTVGDDGIVLYVQPIDRDHHVVKAAGTLTVKLLDPLSPRDRVEYAKYDWDWEHLRPKWYGRLMTHHFTVRCPWRAGEPPAHKEIIVHVVFTELITGKSLTATGTYEISLPPEIPATAE